MQPAIDALSAPRTIGVEEADPKMYAYSVDLQNNSAAAAIVKLVGRGKRVLEIGCASGSQSRILKQQLECDVTGIEVNAEAAAKARLYCRHVIVGDFERMALEQHLKGQQFDVVLFADVLEHLREPAEALRRVKPYIADGGYLCASIPNIVHAAVVMEMVRGNFDYRPQGLLDDTHIRFFTKKSLLHTFEAAGYVVTDIQRVIYSPAATEFATAPMNGEEQTILRYILDHSPESQTYQFIVRALKASGATAGVDSVSTSLQDEVRQLSARLAAANRKVRELESALAWLNRGWLSRAAGAARKLLTGR